MEFPEELKYTRDHEWVSIEGDVATVGITDHAQHELGDVVFVELPAVGRLLPLEAPAELNDALSRFWKDVDTTTTGGKR